VVIIIIIIIILVLACLGSSGTWRFNKCRCCVNTSFVYTVTTNMQSIHHSL